MFKKTRGCNLRISRVFFLSRFNDPGQILRYQWLLFTWEIYCFCPEYPSVRPFVPNCVRSISLRRLEGFSWNFCQMFTSSWRCAEPMSWPYRFKIKVKLGRSKVWAFLSCLLHDISKTAWRYGADTIWDRQTDGRTYGRTSRTKTIYLPCIQ